MSLASFWARKHRREKIRSEEPIENFLFSFAGCPVFAFFFCLRFSAVLVRRLGARVVTCLGLPGPAAGLRLWCGVAVGCGPCLGQLAAPDVVAQSWSAEHIERGHPLAWCGVVASGSLVVYGARVAVCAP